MWYNLFSVGLAMRRKNKDMRCGEIHKSDGFGDVSIIKYFSWRKVKVLFVDYGVEAFMQASDIRLGKCRLPHASSGACGLGYSSSGRYSDKSIYLSKKAEGVWRAMIDRCYNEACENYKLYGAVGVTVCEQWLDYKIFEEWYIENYPDDGKAYALDKDLISKGKRVYSPGTCVFITLGDNSRLAGIQKGENYQYKIRSPIGEIISIRNMARFCRENNLSQTKMSAVSRGERKSHKGWEVISRKKLKTGQ